jgi:protein involved in polysaccharide export with SLBB domain
MQRSGPSTGRFLHGALVRWAALAVLLACPIPATGLGGAVQPGHVLEITVAGRPDLGRLRTVQTTGVIWMPRLAEVPVAGLTAEQVGAKLTALLGRHEPARPVVTARVVDEQPAYVQVLGAVGRPGRQKLETGPRLFDALLAAGGFTPEASGDVLVERREGTFEDGTPLRRFQLPRGDPTPAALAALETRLAPGDVVTAASSDYVTVKGDGVRPGRYRLEGPTTVTGVIAFAGGIARSKARHVTVHRRDPSGRVSTLQADLAAIARGREQDPPLLPDDTVEVGPMQL